MDQHTPKPAPSAAAAVEDDIERIGPFDLDNPHYLHTLKDQLERQCEAAAAEARTEAAGLPPFGLAAAQPHGEDAVGDSRMERPPPVDLADRWTKPKMAEFLRVLAAQQSVAAAARAVGMSRQSAYKLRNRLKGEPFDIAWEAAFQHGYDALHQAALERALHGVEVPVYSKGEQIGTRRHFDERLTVFLLSRRNAVGAQRLGRYAAAAEFWSERWERMLEQVESGPVVWLDDDGRRMQPADEKAASSIMIRHALDAGEERARWGRGR